MLECQLIRVKKLEDAPAERNAQRTLDARHQYVTWMTQQGVNKTLIFLDEAGKYVIYTRFCKSKCNCLNFRFQSAHAKNTWTRSGRRTSSAAGGWLQRPQSKYHCGHLTWRWSGVSGDTCGYSQRRDFWNIFG